MAMAAICNFVVNPVFSLLPLLVSQHFQGEAMHLGWLQSAQGIGFIAGGLVLSVWGGFKRRIYTSLTGLILQGLTIALLGVTPSSAFWMAVANWGLGAFMNVFYNGPIAALLQAVVPPDIQGRVFTAMQSIVWIAWPLSLAIAGPVADWAGIRTWYVVGGAACMILGIGALFMPAIINMEQEAGARAGRQTDALGVA